MENWVAASPSPIPTNRKWVFRARTPTSSRRSRASWAPASPRWALDYLLNQLLVNVLGIDYRVTTVIVGVVVVIGNYVISKLFVFKKKKDEA